MEDCLCEWLHDGVSGEWHFWVEVAYWSKEIPTCGSTQMLIIFPDKLILNDHSVKIIRSDLICGHFKQLLEQFWSKIVPIILWNICRWWLYFHLKKAIFKMFSDKLCLLFLQINIIFPVLIKLWSEMSHFVELNVTTTSFLHFTSSGGQLLWHYCKKVI